MKNLIMFAMFIMAFALSSCSDVERPEPSVQATLQETLKTRSSEVSTLSFESMEDFQTAVAHIATLSSEEEKLEWINKNYPNFRSIQLLYWEAMEEMANTDAVEAEQFNAFEQKYESLYFPKYEEDAGFYIPMTNLDAAFLVNENCEVAIADAILNLKDINDYHELAELGRAFYSIESPMPITEMGSFNLNSTSMNSVGPEYDSGWTQYGDRKVKLKARRKFNTIQMAVGFNGSESVMHFEFCFRKKTWLGWSNYSSKSTIEFKASLPGGRTLGPVLYSHSGTSSHDSETPYPIRISSDASHWYYTFDAAPCEAVINYQGVSQTLKYNWIMPGIQCVTPLTANPAPILPQL